MGFLRRGNQFISSLFNLKDRPPYEAYYAYVLAVLVGYWIADLSILTVRPALLPTQPPPTKPATAPDMTFTNISQYGRITERNIFNQDGQIPPKLSGEGAGIHRAEADPVPSQLPLKLEGTLVHSNPKKSVATIHLRSKNETNAYSPEDNIEGMAQVVRVERRRVILRNSNNGRLEYIEIPKDTAVTFGVRDPFAGSDVQKRGENEWTMRRSDIAKYTADLGNILQQARVVPNIIPGSGGRVDGFRFVAIQPGSIYEKLGFKPMDVIKKVNNEEVNSPTKAMELYNALRNESRIQLTIERNGREETFNYEIVE